MNHKAYFQKLYLVFKDKYCIWFLLVMVVSVLFSQHYSFAFNFSYSLPHKVYLIEKNSRNIKELKHGDYIAFDWQGEFYPVGTQMIKELVGMPGDTVSQKDREFFVNGNPVGVAKKYSMDGMKLEANHFSGSIPKNFVWVKGEHKDSLDSRYEMAGLIHTGQFIGKAIPIF